MKELMKTMPLEGNIVIKIWPFLIMDYRSVGIYLESMALKGYRLVSLNRTFPLAFYKRIQPRRIHYCADLCDDYDGLAFQEYLSLCLESGWQHIGRKRILQIFECDEKAGLIPTQTDPDIEYRNARSIAFRKCFLSRLAGIILPLVLLLNSFLFPFNHFLLLSIVGNFMIFLVLILILLPLIYWWSALHALHRLKYAAKEKRKDRPGKGCPAANISSAKRAGWMFSGFSAALYSLIFASVIAETLHSLTLFLFALFTPLILAAAAINLYNAFKSVFTAEGRHPDRKYRNAQYIKIAKIVIVTLLTLAVLAPVSALAGSSFIPDPKPLRAATGSAGSFCVPATYSLQRYSADLRPETTNCYVARNPFFAKLIYSDLIRITVDPRIHDTFRSMSPLEIPDDYIDGERFGADEAYFHSETNTLILKNGTIVLYLYGSMDFFSPDEILSINQIFAQLSTFTAPAAAISPRAAAI